MPKNRRAKQATRAIQAELGVPYNTARRIQAERRAAAAEPTQPQDPEGDDE